MSAFGPFTATALDLRGAPAGDFHIICGPNEVGKSTAQRAIGDFLFGIAPRSTDNQLHRHEDMRLTATFFGQDAKRHELVRRKGRRDTLLGPDAKPADEDVLEAMLGGMTRDVFETMFSITHRSLVVGGEALLKADGELGESLFSASLGATGLHEVRAELDRQADALFRPRATSSKLLQVKSQLEAARVQMRELTLRTTTYTEHERASRAVEQTRKGLVAEISVARAADRGRRRQRAVIPLLAKREQLVGELAELDGVPELADDATQDRLVQTERETAGLHAAEGAARRVENLQQRITHITPDNAVLEHDLAIKELHGRVVNVQESASDLARQRGKLETAEQLAGRALAKLRPDLTLESAAPLRLTETQKANIDAALGERARLTALQEGADDTAAACDDTVAELALQRQSLEVPRDVTALEGAVAAAQAEGPIAARIETTSAALADQKDRLTTALRLLDPPAGLHALRDMQPPSVASAQELADDKEALGQGGRQLGERRERLEAQRRDIDEAQDGLALGSNAPSVEGLEDARRLRDRRWGALRQRLEDPECEAPDPDTFEGDIQRADDVADRLRAEADDVVRRADLTVRERRLLADEQAIERDERALSEDEDGWRRRWDLAWISVPVVNGSPARMIKWLADREAVLERADGVASSQRALESEQTTLDGHLARLGADLPTPPPETSTLPGLVAMGVTCIEEARGLREQHRATERDLSSARTDAAKHSEKSAGYGRELERWAETWGKQVAEHGWPAGTAPEAARGVLAVVNELKDQLDEVESLNTRVQGIESRIAAFDRDAAALIEVVAPGLASRAKLDAVVELDRRRSEALEARGDRAALQSQLEESHADAARAAEAIAAARGALETMVSAAGVETVDELPEAERRAQRAADLRALVPELEDQIVEAGEASLAKLIEQTRDVHTDALDAQSVQAGQDLSDLEEQLRELDVEIGKLNSERQAMGLQGAAQAAEHVEQLTAELRDVTERYVTLDLAAWALSEAIDHYRQEHKAPLLGRADELFPRLTRGGEYKGLEVAFDERDEPALVAVETCGTTKSVQALSTGTREQLYLALRFAALERHMQLHGPMPVVLDDVVLHSDPDRKTAILEALADLGSQTQVVTFTHDPQVVALAQNAIDPDRLTVHELGGTQISGALQPQIAAADVRPIRPADTRAA